MDIASRRVELIEWLAQLQDENLISQIELLKNRSLVDSYEFRTPKRLEDIQEKLNRADEDIKAGRLHTQQQVRSYFESKFGK